MRADESLCCPHSAHYLQAGSHVCFLYADDDDRRGFLASWLGPLAEDATEPPPSLVAVLSRHGLAPGLLAAGGRLQAPPTQHAAPPSGRGAYPGASTPLCLAIEVPAGDAGAVQRHEEAIAALVATEALAVICLYDRRRFGADVLLDAMGLHPLVARAEAIVANPYYRADAATDIDDRLNARLRAIDELAALRSRADWGQELYARVFVNSPVALEVFDGRGRLIDANPAAVGMRGAADVASMIGRDLFSTPELPPDARQRLLAGEWLRFETLKQESGPRRAGGADQETVYHDVIVNHLHSAPGFLLQTIDTSHQRRMAEDLKRQEALYRSLVERSPMVTYMGVVGSEGVQEYVSPQIEGLLGFTPEEWARDLSIWQRQLHPDDRERVLAAERRLRQAERDFDEVYRFLSRDGRVVWVHDRAGVVRDEAGRPIAYQGVMLDITPQQEALEALRHSEARLRAILQTTQEGFLLLDEAGRFVDANDAYIQMSGYSRDELLTLSILDLDAMHGLPDVLARAERIDANGGEMFETRHRRKDGSHFDVSVAVRALHEGDGVLYFAFVRDITEITQATEALARSEMRYRLLVENSPVAIYAADLQHPELPPYVSPVAEQMLGYPVSAWHAPDFLSGIIHPDDRAEAIAGWQRALTQREPYSIECRVIAKNGRVVWVHGRSSALYDGEGHLQMLQGVLVDITKQKEAQLALLASQRRFREVLDNLQMVAVAVDAQGRIEYANPYLLGLTGWSSEDVLQQDWVAMFVPEGPARAQYAEVLAGALSGGKPTANFEAEITTRDGRSRLIRWSSAVLRDPAGAPIGMASIGEDITTRRRLEEQLRQAQKMETVGRLAGGIAHDFNNLLTTITGYGEFVQENLPPGSAASHDIGEVLRAADHASDLTRQLLAFSRRQVIQPRIMSLNDLVLGLEKTLRRLVGEQIELRISADQSAWPVLVDPVQIEQVIGNLAENARDAMPRGGILTIETANRPISAALAETFLDVEPGDYVCLIISDTGVGMSKEVQAHLFEPFFTTKGTGEGVGLGLSTAYGIIKQHGGHIAVQSAPGEGTRFLVYLPRAVGQTDGVAKTHRQVLDAGSEAVLVVEDEAAVRRVMSRILTGAGYVVLEAGSAAEAVALMEEHPDIDLLLTDVIMPQIDGKELADRLRAERPDLKVLFVSGYPQDEVSEEGRLASGLAFMSKPFTASALTTKVRAVLDGERLAQ